MTLKPNLDPHTWDLVLRQIRGVPVISFRGILRWTKSLKKGLKKGLKKENHSKKEKKD